MNVEVGRAAVGIRSKGSGSRPRRGGRRGHTYSGRSGGRRWARGITTPVSGPALVAARATGGSSGGSEDGGKGDPVGVVVVRRNDLGYRTRFETVTSLEALKMGGYSSKEAAEGASWVLDEAEEAPGAWDAGDALEAGRQAESVRRKGDTAVRVRLKIDPAGADLYVRGTVDTTVRCDCRRCLCDVHVDLALPFNVLLTHTPANGGPAGSSSSSSKKKRRKREKGQESREWAEDEDSEGVSGESDAVATGNGVTVKKRGGKKNRVDQTPREDELFFPSGENERDLSAVVRDTVLLSIPTDALCSEDCRGITNPYGTVTFAGDPDHVELGTTSFSDAPEGEGAMLLDEGTLSQLDGLFGGSDGE